MFAPEIQGKSVRVVEFSRVLHVPELGSNLFSVLYLTRHRGFNVHIYSAHMDFDGDSQTLFCATINASNTAYLAGTVHSALETAQAAATSTSG